jgi:hypothetical protein
VLYNRKIDRALILLIPAALFVYASARPHERLRAEMPQEFVDAKINADPARQEEEDRLAHEYWNCALNTIQWKYTYGSPLPNTPPAEFRANENQTSKGNDESSTRLRYWRQLQRVWLLPTSWKTAREWSTRWLTDPISRTATWVENTLNDFFHGR